jgi:hypothetical protein
MARTDDDAAARAAIEAAVRVALHLIAEHEQASHLTVRISLFGPQFSYEVTKGSPALPASTEAPTSRASAGATARPAAG